MISHRKSWLWRSMNWDKSLPWIMESFHFNNGRKRINTIKPHGFQFLCFSRSHLSKTARQCLFLPNPVVQTCPHTTRDWLAIRWSLHVSRFPSPFLSKAHNILQVYITRNSSGTITEMALIPCITLFWSYICFIISMGRMKTDHEKCTWKGITRIVRLPTNLEIGKLGICINQD